MVSYEVESAVIDGMHASVSVARDCLPLHLKWDAAWARRRVGNHREVRQDKESPPSGV